MKSSGFMKVLMLLLCVFAFVADVAAKDNWTSVKSKNFTLVGNASDKDIRRVATRLEQYRETLRTLFPNSNFEKSTPTVVYVFDSDASFNPFKPRYKGKIQENVAGYFQDGPENSIIALTKEERGIGPYEVIFHEYQHFLLKNNMDNPPLWLNEGLAEFYSTFKINDDNITVQLGVAIARHIYTLRDAKLIPFKTLFSINEKSKEYNESSKSGIFYAESWALLHYLMMGEGGKRQSQLTTFINNLSSGKTTEDNFQQSFGTDYEGMEKELRRYVQNYSFPMMNYSLKQELNFEKEMQSRQLSEAETETQLGILLINLGEPDLAEKRFQKAIAEDERYALAYTWHGYVKLLQKSYDEAEKSLARAVELDPQNYLPYKFRGRLFGVTKKSDAAIKSFERAIELQPNIGRRYADLAEFYVFALGDDARAFTNYNKAMRLEPREPNYFYSASIISLRLHNGMPAALQAQTFLRLKGWDNDSSPYAALTSYFGYQIANQPKNATKILELAMSHLDESIWARSIMRYLHGEISSEDLLGLATDKDKQTEAHAYIGLNLLLDGKKEEAMPHYNWVKDNGNRNFIEYQLVLAELKRLEAEKSN